MLENVRGFETSENKLKIYNEYNYNLFTFGKIINYLYIPMSIIAMILYGIMRFIQNDTRYADFIGRMCYISYIFNIVAIIYSNLQIVKSFLYYFSNNKDRDIQFGIRDLIAITLMIHLLITLLTTCPCHRTLPVLINLIFYVILLCFLTQYLYCKTFSKIDFIFIIFLILVMLAPYVIDSLELNISSAFRGYTLAISGMFIIVSTIFDYKRPMVSNANNIKVVLVIAVIIMIQFDMYVYREYFGNHSVLFEPVKTIKSP